MKRDSSLGAGIPQITVLTVLVLLVATNLILTWQQQRSTNALRATLRLRGPDNDQAPRGLYMGDGRLFCFVEPLGLSMLLESRDKGITVHLCRGRGWEPETSSIFKRLVKEGDVVLDVGANVGYFTLLFSQLVGPTGKVVGVEASPRTWDLASTSVELNGLSGWTKVLHRAVYDEDNKEVHISISRDRTLNNRLVESTRDSKDVPSDPAGSQTTVAVRTITIDSAVSGWPRLDLVKIDVEGAEAHAYRGMKATFERFPDLILVMEVNTYRMGVTAAKAFYAQLQSDFPILRKFQGDDIVPTTEEELLANTSGDDMVVLTKREGSTWHTRQRGRR